MISYPCAKINLGLNIISKRADGYHNLETVFFPIPLCDKLEVSIIENKNIESKCHLSLSGGKLLGIEEDNLVVKAYNLLQKDFKLPAVKATLQKVIPSQAGMGGGSSDAAEMLKIINILCNLNLSTPQLQNYATKLGADCAFFIEKQPAFATGIGEQLEELNTLKKLLKHYYIVLIKPEIAVSTAKAFKLITPTKPSICCKEIVFQPIEKWKHALINDFEEPIFSITPELKLIKENLYNLGAKYASMSGSGSTIFGLFKEKPQKEISKLFPNMFCQLHQL